MIIFSPAKVNIGLQIIERCGDGFHNLQSIMFPVGLCDILEIRESTEGGESFQFSQSGIQIDCTSENNLCVKAWRLFTNEMPLPPVIMHLHKQIPIGAGLGGGSSNATQTLRGMNKLVKEVLSEEELHELATRLGSDCPFFLHNKPMMLEGRGDILSPITLATDHLYMVLLFPEIHISTSEAYGDVHPAIPDQHLKVLINEPIDQWKNLIINDFELSVFKRYPLLERIKRNLYQAGALYASLSGSGSSMYGLFSVSPELPKELGQYIIWRGTAAGNSFRQNKGFP